MRHLWFITNPASGSTSAGKCAAIEAVFGERGLTLVGRTAFPADPLPGPAMLEAAAVDTVVLFAGDGTINAAIGALAEWRGAILILPGGTMNLLAKSLHGAADPAAIIHAAHHADTLVALPCVEVGERRALVGLILGPAAHWVRAREMVRAGRLRGIARAVSHAWRRTFARGIRLEGVAGLPHRAQAVVVRPAPDHLAIAAVEARAWRAIAALGWEWLTGDWVAAAAVTQCRVSSFCIAGNRPALALFDGEPVMLGPGAMIGGGMTRAMFLKTLKEAA